MKKITLLSIFLFSLFAISLQAQTSEKTIKLVVSGEAGTKEEATKIALRNAIEQAFGTFVSADTEILNDELIKDEIVTISSGNIQSYKEVNSIKNADGTQSVTLETVVSIGKLVNFAKSKGMSTELAGATFAMNMKIRELNKKNERIALKNLYEQLDLMASNVNLFDYELITGEPFQTDDGNYAINLLVNVRPNENAKEFLEIYKKTMNSLSLTESEKKEYASANLKFYGLDYKVNCFLRNDYWGDNEYMMGNRQPPIELAFVKSMFKFSISDNMNNKVELFYTKDEELMQMDTAFEITKLRHFSLNDEYLFSNIMEEYYFFSVSFSEHGDFGGIARNEGGAHGWYRGEMFENYTWDKYKSGDVFFQFKFGLIYTKEAFEKITSINIEPTSTIKYMVK